MFFLHIINNEVIYKTVKQTPIIKLEHIHNHLKSDLSLNAVFVIRFISHFVIVEYSFLQAALQKVCIDVGVVFPLILYCFSKNRKISQQRHLLRFRYDCLKSVWFLLCTRRFQSLVIG